MRRIALITGIILIVCTVISGLYTTETNAETKVKSTLNTSTETTACQNTYIIKTLNGNVTVYIKGNNEPYMFTETRVANLPKSDAKMLENGIEICGTENLRKALEDFCS